MIVMFGTLYIPGSSSEDGAGPSGNVAFPL